MSETAVGIIEIIIVLLGLAAVLLPFVAFIIYVMVITAKRKQAVRRITAANQQLIGTKRWLPVRYASEPRFKALFKIFPWEGAGILVMAPGSVVFLGDVKSSPLTLQFAPGNSTIDWLGKCPWPNGAVSWFAFNSGGQNYYFSSETGAFVFGSDRGTRELFDSANRSFAGQA